MVYHILFHEANRCDMEIVANSALSVHVKTFVMGQDNFYLEPHHCLQYLFLYCFLPEKM